MKKIFTFFIVLLPILSIYKSPIPKLDLATFFICCISPFILLKIKKIKLSNENKRVKIVLMILCIYIIISTLISCMLQNEINYSNILLRTVKFIFLIIIIICISYDYLFDFSFGIKVLKYVTLLSCFYIILQTISFYLFHTTLQGVLMSYILQGDYFEITYEQAASLVLYRPTSFFLEPSTFSEYVILYLTYVLFNKDIKNRYIQAVFMSIGILLSTSGSGYLYCALIWLIFLYKQYIRKINSKKLILMIILILISLALLPKILNIPIIYQAVERGIDGSATGGNAIVGRIKSFEYISELDFIYQIIGKGYGNPVDGKFMNSMSYIIYCCGFVGFIILIIFMINLLKVKSKNLAKNVFVFIWMISLFFTTSFVAIKICFYLAFLLIEEGDDYNEKFS